MTKPGNSRDVPCTLLTVTACSMTAYCHLSDMVAAHYLYHPTDTGISEYSSSFLISWVPLLGSRTRSYMLILTICFKPHPTNVLSSCTTLSPLLSRNPGPQKKFCPYPKPICISLDRSNTVGTFDPLLEKPTDSLVNICIWPTLPGKTSLEKEALEPSLVKKYPH